MSRPLLNLLFSFFLFLIYSLSRFSFFLDYFESTTTRYNSNWCLQTWKTEEFISDSSHSLCIDKV